MDPLRATFAAGSAPSALGYAQSAPAMSEDPRQAPSAIPYMDTRSWGGFSPRTEREMRASDYVMAILVIGGVVGAIVAIVILTRKPPICGRRKRLRMGGTSGDACNAVPQGKKCDKYYVQQQYAAYGLICADDPSGGCKTPEDATIQGATCAIPPRCFDPCPNRTLPHADSEDDPDPNTTTGDMCSDYSQDVCENQLGRNANLDVSTCKWKGGKCVADDACGWPIQDINMNSRCDMNHPDCSKTAVQSRMASCRTQKPGEVLGTDCKRITRCWAKESGDISSTCRSTCPSVTNSDETDWCPDSSLNPFNDHTYCNCTSKKHDSGSDKKGFLNAPCRTADDCCSGTCTAGKCA